MIGVVNYILKCLKNVLDSLNEWLTNHHINPQPCHGGQFNDPDCRKILKKSDIKVIATSLSKCDISNTFKVKRIFVFN